MPLEQQHDYLYTRRGRGARRATGSESAGSCDDAQDLLVADTAAAWTSFFQRYMIASRAFEDALGLARVLSEHHTLYCRQCAK